MSGAALAERLRLYVVTDEGPDPRRLLQQVERAIAGGATAVQLRRKAELGRRFVEIGRQLRALTRERGVLLLVNDRVDVAQIVDADGVHVGQDDITCQDARRLLGDRIVGVSATTLAEALAAERDGADYLGVGSVFPTGSKPDAELCGLEGLAEMARAVHVPVVAIGGIHLGNVHEVVRAGADGIAVVSAVMSALDPAQAARSLLQAVSDARVGRTRGAAGAPTGREE
ncbi:MAG: thiamine phosphate synthase [Alicyclobacillus sp.]|nr:thiamine phosphate synthase [Alicyclobacillus sp.]